MLRVSELFEYSSLKFNSELVDQCWSTFYSIGSQFYYYYFNSKWEYKFLGVLLINIATRSGSK